MYRLFTFLCAVFTAAAFAAFNAKGIERAADDMVANARQVADAPAPDQHDTVLLQVVLLAGDIRRHFLAVAQADAGDFAQRRVGLLGGHGLDLKAHAAFLRAGLQVLDLIDPRQTATRLLDQLIDRRHLSFPV